MQHSIAQYGYVADLTLVLPGSACVPVPPKVTTLLGGTAGAVTGGHLNPAIVMVVGTLAGSRHTCGLDRRGGLGVPMRRCGRRPAPGATD